MVELRRDDLQLFLIHYSFFLCLFCIVIYIIRTILNLKSTPKMTPKSTPKMILNSTPKMTPKKTPDSTPSFTTCPNLISFSYNIIAHSLRKIHISGNREKKLFKD